MEQQVSVCAVTEAHLCEEERPVEETIGKATTDRAQNTGAVALE